MLKRLTTHGARVSKLRAVLPSVPIDQAQSWAYLGSGEEDAPYSGSVLLRQSHPFSARAPLR